MVTSWRGNCRCRWKDERVESEIFGRVETKSPQCKSDRGDEVIWLISEGRKGQNEINRVNQCHIKRNKVFITSFILSRFIIRTSYPKFLFSLFISNSVYYHGRFDGTFQTFSTDSFFFFSVDFVLNPTILD